MQVSFKQSPQAARATTKSSDVTRMIYASRAVPMAARNAVVGLKRVFRQVWDVYGMFFCSVPQQGTRREHTQNSTSCGHFRFPHVSGVWVGVGVGHEHKATVHEAFLHGNPGYQPNHKPFPIREQ